MSFLVELWESIFTPGTSPALIKATHGSFILLLLSLLFLIYYTKSIHFINLFFIALFLYAAVIWFVNELKSVKLKENQDLLSEGTQSKDAKQEEESATERIANLKEVAGTTATSSPLATRRRKV